MMEGEVTRSWQRGVAWEWGSEGEGGGVSAHFMKKGCLATRLELLLLSYSC